MRVLFEVGGGNVSDDPVDLTCQDSSVLHENSQ